MKGGLVYPHPPTSPKRSLEEELSCSPPSCSSLQVGQCTVLSQEIRLESAWPLPLLFLVPSAQPSTEISLTQCSSDPQCPPIVPQPEKLSAFGHRHGITPDREKRGSAFRAKMGCPLHSQGKKTCMEAQRVFLRFFLTFTNITLASLPFPFLSVPACPQDAWLAPCATHFYFTPKPPPV